MDEIFEKLLAGTEKYCNDSDEPADVAGELKAVLHSAWNTMLATQKRELLGSPIIAKLLTSSSLCTVGPRTLIESFNCQLVQQEALVSANGYSFGRRDEGFYWKTSDLTSTDFQARDDAVVNANMHFSARCTSSWSVTLQMESGNKFNWLGTADDKGRAEGLAIEELESQTGEQVYEIVNSAAPFDGSAGITDITE